VVILHHPSFCIKDTLMDDREEMRRLIDMIEKSAGSNTIEQAVDDLKTFANTASFLANKLDKRLKVGDVKRKKPAKPGKGMGLSKPSPPPIPKSRNLPKPQDSVSGMPQATSTSISQADYDKVKPVRPIGALSANEG
jgi:hypothetical protein